MSSLNEFRIEQSSLIQALEQYREMETVLEEERENLQNIISQESSKWQGEAAEAAVSSMNYFLQTGEYNEAYECVRKVRLCMEDTLDQVSALLVRCEDFPKQLESDTYIESMRPACGDYTLRNGGVLYLDYGKALIIPDLCDQISETADYLGTVLKQSMEDCRGIIDNIDGYQNRVDEAVRKVKRVENYKLSFQKYVQGIKALENDVAINFCKSSYTQEVESVNNDMQRSNGNLEDRNVVQDDMLLYNIIQNDERFYGMSEDEIYNLIEYIKYKYNGLINSLYITNIYSSYDFEKIRKIILEKCYEQIEHNNIEINEMISISLTQEGEGERGGNDNQTIYNDWYYGESDGQAWCSVFVLWCADQAGLLNGDFLPTIEDCRNGLLERVRRVAVLYSGKGLYHCIKEQDTVVSKEIDWASSGEIEMIQEAQNNIIYDDYKPRNGDFIIIQENGGEHIGIVIGYDEEKDIVYTIEGNAGNEVIITGYYLSEEKIQGFCENGGTETELPPDIDPEEIPISGNYGTR